jgi:uncharacterized protein with NAD-binding domain and iron-sulfur cluster
VARERIAIIGGGCGGVAAAFWLTSGPLRDRYDVTLYSQGWRLGGKGASGRGPAPDHRIEEHGLHLWLGCYHRAFQLMRLCYAELGERSAFKGLAEAFVPLPGFDLGGFEPAGQGAAAPPWRLRMPVSRSYPGEGLASPLALVADRFEGLFRKRDLGGRGTRGGRWRPRFHPLRGLLRLAVMAGLSAVFLKGLLADIVFAPGDFDARIAALEEEDFRDWLARHGAGRAVRDCPPVRGIYDLAFAYPDGDCGHPGALAAGSTIGLILQMAAYRGAPLFKMASGMGDTIFAPLYRVLEARGVKIALFHRLRSASPDPSGASIEALHLDRQAALAKGRYDPFVTIGGADCWPNQPLWDQLEDGAALRERGVNFEDSRDDTAVERITLRHGRDFDTVILATPPEALKATTVELADPRWKRMLDESASVATQAYQLWLDASTRDLGGSADGLLSAYAPPFSTWADMSHLLGAEAWAGSGAPRSIHYVCGPLPDHAAVRETSAAHVEVTLRAWLGEAVAAIFPHAAGEDGGPPGRGWLSANHDPSERYVQAPPGGTRHRLASDARVYDNLYLAGDWTRTRFCGGCVENAVQSGLAAARAICGRPDLGGADAGSKGEPWS